MNEDFRTFNNAQFNNNDTEALFPNNLPTQQEMDEATLNALHDEAASQKPTLDKVFSNPDTTIDEETGEVTTLTTSQPAPAVKQNAKGSYKVFVLAPSNMPQRITNALNQMIANGDTELSAAMQQGKKTIEGCIRYLNNTLADLGRELKQKGLTAYDDDDIHFVARYYFVNPDCQDVQNVANAVAKKKETKTNKTQQPNKTQQTNKTNKTNNPKVLPLTPQMGSLFGDDDFE